MKVGRVGVAGVSEQPDHLSLPDAVAEANSEAVRLHVGVEREMSSPDLDHEDQNVAITDLIQHAVVSDSDSEIVGIAGELLTVRWSWVGRQRSDGVPNSRPDSRRNA